MSNITYTYSADQVAEILGIDRNELTKMIDDNEFPFQIIKAGNRYIFPAKPFDEFINGRRSRTITRAGKYPNLRTKLLKTGRYVNFNHPVDRKLSDAFDVICLEANRNLEVPLYKWEWLNVAIQEFIDRRKSYLNPDR